MVLGIVSGVLASLVSVLALAWLFAGFRMRSMLRFFQSPLQQRLEWVYLEELGGIVTITVAVIIITGVLGNMIAEAVCRIARINQPIAKGLALLVLLLMPLVLQRRWEMGEVEGAMSSLAIAVSSSYSGGSFCFLFSFYDDTDLMAVRTTVLAAFSYLYLWQALQLI